jgi:hypothetical protein
MAGIISGVAPVKAAVDQILMACKQIVQSKAVPGAEQPCSQIEALATSMLPMAVQAAMQPGPAQGGLPPVGPPLGPGGQ